MESSTVDCGICFADKVVGICENCECKLCETCFRNHTRAKMFSTHIIFPIEEDTIFEASISTDTGLKSPVDTDIHKQTCKDHSDEKQSLYCEKHDVCICGRCLISNHTSCLDSVVDLNNIPLDANHVNKSVSFLQELDEEIDSIMAKIDENRRVNDTCRSSSAKEIHEFHAALVDQLNIMMTKAENESDELHKQNTDILDKTELKCQGHKQVLRQQMKLLDELEHKKALPAFVLALKRNGKNIELLKDKNARYRHESNITEYGFVRNLKLLEKNNEDQQMGTLTIPCDGSEEVIEDVDEIPVKSNYIAPSGKFAMQTGHPQLSKYSVLRPQDMSDMGASTQQSKGFSFGTPTTTPAVSSAVQSAKPASTLSGGFVFGGGTAGTDVASSGFFGAKPKTTAENMTSGKIDEEPKKDLASMFKKKEGTWTCDGCYVNNGADIQKCLCCGTRKPGVKAEDIKAPAGASSFGSSTSGGFTFNTAATASAPQTGGGLASMFKKKEGTWTCDGCYVNNGADIQKCLCCGTRKPRMKAEDIKAPAGASSFGSSTSGGFTFNTAATASAPQTGGGFKFGSAQQSGVSSTSGSGSGFTFRSSSASTQQSKMFSFGTPTTTPAGSSAVQSVKPVSTPSGGFVFGGGSTPATGFGTAGTDAASSGFFGTKPKTSAENMTGNVFGGMTGKTPAETLKALSDGVPSSAGFDTKAIETASSKAKSSEEKSCFIGQSLLAQYLSTPDEDETSTRVKSDVTRPSEQKPFSSLSSF